MKKRIAALILAAIIGAVLGYLLVTALDNGWFRTKWRMIEKPPGEALHLVALSQDRLWVQVDSGTIYYNENSSTCKSDCWQEVTEIPALPILEPNETTVSSEACAPPLPLSGVTDRISECRITMWVDHNFTFALRKDGTLVLWQTDIYKEWEVVLLFLGVCIGGIALFIPTLVIVLFLGLRDRRSKRTNKNAGREGA
jgi:hypothetical protein